MIQSKNLSILFNVTKREIKTLSISFLMLFICVFASSQAEIDEIKKYSILSNSINNEFISQSVKNFDQVRILGMGEASHGASEFFTTKVEFFKYLALQKRYKTFVIESTFSTAYLINQYCVSGKGEAKESLKYLDNFYWYSQEVLDLMHWIREYNENKAEKDKIWVLGMDSNSRKNSKYLIASYINKMEKAINRNPEARLNGRDLKRKSSTKKKQKFKEDFEAQRDLYIRHSSEWEFEFFKQAIVNLLDYNGMKRDEIMSKNITWLSQVRSSKIFIWAHNEHVKNTDKRLGNYLKKEFADDYYSLGFDFLEGQFWAQKGSNVVSVIWHGAKNVKLSTTPPKMEYLTYKLGQVKSPFLFIDLASSMLKSSQLHELFSSEQYRHSTTSWHSKKTEYQKAIINNEFDGLIYIEKISPSHQFYLVGDQ